jgi:hypothetical protein
MTTNTDVFLITGAIVNRVLAERETVSSTPAAAPPCPSPLGTAATQWSPRPLSQSPALHRWTFARRNHIHRA